MTLPSSHHVANVRRYLRPTLLETPGPDVVGDDHVARPGASTSRTVRVAVFDSPGRRTSGAVEGQTTGGRSVTGYALVEVNPAKGLAAVQRGDLVHWDGDRFEVGSAVRWADGGNSQTFFEFTAARISA